MIRTKIDLQKSLNEDSKNFKAVLGFKKRRHQLFTSPISDQWYIWKYIQYLRKSEYHLNNKGYYHKFLALWCIYRLRRFSRITGFQIPPNVIGPGLTIWHWGPIIINEKAKLGNNCVLNPMVIVGHKIPTGTAPVIGNNVFIGGGAKIIGAIIIGNNVIVAPNAVVVKDVPDNVIVAGVPAKVIGKVE